MTTEAGVPACWRRIEAWLAAHAPALAKGLRPPAAAEDVAEAEAALGIRFPPDFAASLAVHDGQDGGAFEVFGDWGLLDLQGCVRKWRLLSSMAGKGVLHVHDEPGWVFSRGPVRPRAWDPGRIPFATMGTGDYLMLDMDPAPGGDVGQVVTYAHDSPAREVVAAGFGAWLHQVADRLESGAYVPVAGGAALSRDR